MPVIIVFLHFRISINDKDHNPPHCHINGKGGSARYDLKSMEYMSLEGFSKSDARKIEEIIKTYRDELMEAWEVRHGKR